MSLINEIKTTLEGYDDLQGVMFNAGEYPLNAADPCGKIVFTGEEKPVSFFGGGTANVETFRVIVRGDDYGALEQVAGYVKSALIAEGCVQIGGYEYVALTDAELDEIEQSGGTRFKQVAVSFKAIGQIKTA